MDNPGNPQLYLVEIVTILLPNEYLLYIRSQWDSMCDLSHTIYTIPNIAGKSRSTFQDASETSKTHATGYLPALKRSILKLHTSGFQKCLRSSRRSI